MKACIFDLDGTLTDTLESLCYSVNKTLEEMGLAPIPDDKVRLGVGNGARYLMERSLEAAGDAGASRIEEGMPIYSRIFGENCTYHVVPYEGIVPTIQEMKARGMKLAVLSNKPHAQAIDVVETIFGKGTFDEIMGQKDDVPRKPDPTAVFMILEKLGVDVKDCLYIGDSEVDIKTGRNAGVLSVGVEWGFRDRKVLEEAGAEHIVKTADQLLEF